MDTQWTQALWLTMLSATRVGACSQGRDSEWEDAGSELELLRAVLLRERDRPVSDSSCRTVVIFARGAELMTRDGWGIY